MDFFPDTCFSIRRKNKWQSLFFVKKIYIYINIFNNCRTSERSLCFKYSVKKGKHFIWYSIKFTLNNEMRTKCPYQRQINMLSPRFKDVLSVRVRSNLPAGHSMHSLASEEALTNHPSVHGSNLYFPTLSLANPDCLKAGSSWGLTPYNREMSMYSESPCPKPLKWKIRRIKKINRYLGTNDKEKNSCTQYSKFWYLCYYTN